MTTTAITHFDMTDRTQLLVDGVGTALLYTRLTTPASSDLTKVAVGLGSLAASNYLYNTTIAPALEAVEHPGSAMVDALGADLQGKPQDALVGNALLAGTAYAGYHGVQGAKKGYEAWKSRPQGEVPPETATPEVAEAADAAAPAEESTGEVILESLETVGEGLLDVAPELVFL